MSRPPADTFLHEAFNDQKCGEPNREDKLHFFRWCISADGGIKTKCNGITGGEGLCELEAMFRPRMVSKRSAFISSEPEPVPAPNIPPGEFDIYYNYSCHFGGQKYTRWSDRIEMQRKQYEEIYGLCYQGIYGAPYNWPWWLILLIVLAVLLVLASAFSLFWRYWLKQKIYAKRDPAFASGYTSTPYSSVASAFPSSNSRPRKAPGGSRVRTGRNSAMQGFNSKPSYLMSREPSVRSGRSSSISH